MLDENRNRWDQSWPCTRENRQMWPYAYWQRQTAMRSTSFITKKTADGFRYKFQNKPRAIKEAVTTADRLDTSVKVNHTPRQSSRGVSTQPRLGWRQRHHAVSIRRQGTKGKNSDSLPLTALIKAAGQCQNGPSSEVASSSTIRCAAGHTPRALVRWQSRRQNDQGNEGVRC